MAEKVTRSVRRRPPKPAKGPTPPKTYENALKPIGSSEWYRELGEGRREAFTGRGSETLAAYNRFLDEFKKLPQAQSQAGWDAGRAVSAGEIEQNGGPSVFDRVIDILSRTSYGGSGAVFEGLQGENPITSFWEGFSGQDKRTVSKRLEELGVLEDQDVLRGILGFAGDVAFDPLTYLTLGSSVIPGAVGKGTRVVAGGRTVREAVDEAATPVDEILAAQDEVAGLSPRAAAGPVQERAAAGGAPVRVQIVNQGVNGPADISGITQLLARTEQATKQKIIQRSDLPAGTPFAARTRPPVATATVKDVSETTPKVAAPPVAANIDEAARELPNFEVYVSPHFNRDAAPLPNGLFPLKESTRKELWQLATKQLTDEANAAKVTSEKEVLQVAERAFKEELVDDEHLKSLGVKTLAALKKKDETAYNYYIDQAKSYLINRKGAAPKPSQAAIEARFNRLYAEFSKREDLLEKAGPQRKGTKPATGKKPKDKKAAAPVATAASNPAAVADEAAEFTARAQEAVRGFSPSQVAGLDDAVRITVKEIKANRYKNPHFNPAKQRNLFNQINNPRILGSMKATKTSDSAWNLVLAAYRVAEERVGATVGAATDYRGAPFALSDYLNALPRGTLVTDKLLSDIVNATRVKPKGTVPPEVQALVNQIKAKSVIRQLGVAAPTVNKVEDVLDEAEQVLPAAQADQLKDKLPKAAKDEAAASGLPKTLQEAVEKSARDVIEGKYPKTTVAHEIDTASRTYAAQTYTYRTTDKARKAADDERLYQLNHNIFEQQRKYLNIKMWGKRIAPPIPLKRGPVNETTALVTRKAQEAGRSPEIWGRALNTAYQMSHIQPALRQYAAGAEGFATQRTIALNNLFESTPGLKTVDEQTNAWATLGLDRTPTPEAQAIKDFLRTWFDSKDSFMTRSGINIYDLNMMLARNPGYKFEIRREFQDTLGNTHRMSDFPNQFDGLIAQITSDPRWSLERHGSKSPVAGMMYDLVQASEKLAAEVYAMRHLGDLLGTPKKVKGFVPIEHPAFRNQTVYFDPVIASEWAKYQELMHSFKPSAKIWQNYDEALSLWKSGVLNYSPSYHMRNMVGDMYLSFLAGVTNPRRYLQAGRVLKGASALRQSDEFFTPFDEIAGMRNVRPDTPIIRHPKLGNINSDELLAGFTKYGGAQNIALMENLGTGLGKGFNINPRGPEGIRGIRPFGGKIRDASRGLSNFREDFARMAHFIDAVTKSKATNLDDAMRTAMQEVRKYHFDYGDLTKFEIFTMRRFIPFYTWMRKSIPLLLEKGFEHPWKVAVVPKANYAIAEMTGQDPQDFANPYPAGTENLFPNWIKETAATPWFSVGGNYVTGAIPDPATETIAEWDEPIEATLGSLTPFAKWPIETVLRTSEEEPYGSRLATGIPITDRSTYIDQQIPVLGNIGRLTNTSPVAGGIEELLGALGIMEAPEPGRGFAKTTDPSDPGGAAGANLVAILNILSGLGLQENTPSRQYNALVEEQKRLRDAVR